MTSANTVNTMRNISIIDRNYKLHKAILNKTVSSTLLLVYVEVSINCCKWNACI